MATIFTKRVGAYILDFFVLSAIMWIVSFIVSFFFNPYDAYEIYSYFVYLVPVLIIVYFAVLEKTKGATVGKAIMNIEVLDDRGYTITWPQAILRNLSKLFWFPIIFDWAIGSVLGKGDRILDRLTYTKVIYVSNRFR